MAGRPSRLTRQYRPSYTQSNQDQARAKWTAALTETLADLMVEEVAKGNKQKNNSFGKKAWKNICDEFQNRTGLKWEKEQLKNRYGALRKQYTTMKSLLDINDFTWDEGRQIVMATNEVWDEHIKAHPDVETIRANGCPLYKQLCIIFSESGTNGNSDQHVEMEGDPCPKTTGLSVDTGPGPLLVLPEEELELSTSEDDDEETKPTTKNKQQVVTTPSTYVRKKPMRTDEVMLKAVIEMAASSKLRAAAVAEGSDRFSITNCVEALDEMQGVDDHMYYTALDLFDKPNFRETFISLKCEKRLLWLKAKCNAVHSSMA